MEYTCGNCEGDIKNVESGICPHCDTPFELPLESIPWERGTSVGWFGAYAGTVIMSLTKPTEYFKRIPTTGGFSTPIIYALINGLLGSWFNLAWQILFVYLGIIETDPQSPDDTMGFNILIAVLSPILIPLGIIVGTVLINFSLTILGVKNNDFEATFRIVCYSSGASVLAIIPAIGSIIGAFWSLSLEASGLREVYAISHRRAFTAILLPIFLIFTLLMILTINSPS